ncbi:UPF0235 protein C15orf40 homolog isoform X1 [Excalfactoria chinensis]|uniref:UPF0235 protein C15orf40 homolog isoform X1 n=1 Tax=Excalfactoria chinensis TaxID=46218 RepID=UPI003B3ABFBE
MLGLAGFRQRLAAPLRGGGGAMPRKGKAAGKEHHEPGAAAGPVVATGDGGVRVSVRAKPGSRCSAVTDVTAEAVGVAIAAPPSEGEANTELCRYLSKVLEVKKSDVILEKVLLGIWILTGKRLAPVPPPSFVDMTAVKLNCFCRFGRKSCVC